MITPKEKAEELYNRADMIIYTDQDYNSQCKQVANLVCNEVLKALDLQEFEVPNTEFKFWQSVKQEIENL
jgi:hypothetical protein